MSRPEAKATLLWAPAYKKGAGSPPAASGRNGRKDGQALSFRQASLKPPVVTPSLLDPAGRVTECWPPVVSPSEAVASAEQIDERQLVAASLGGDEEAFRRLVERHYRLTGGAAERLAIAA